MRLQLWYLPRVTLVYRTLLPSHLPPSACNLWYFWAGTPQVPNICIRKCNVSLPELFVFAPLPPFFRSRPSFFHRRYLYNVLCLHTHRFLSTHSPLAFAIRPSQTSEGLTMKFYLRGGIPPLELLPHFQNWRDNYSSGPGKMLDLNFLGINSALGPNSKSFQHSEQF